MRISSSEPLMKDQTLPQLLYPQYCSEHNQFYSENFEHISSDTWGCFHVSVVDKTCSWDPRWRPSSPPWPRRAARRSWTWSRPCPSGCVSRCRPPRSWGPRSWRCCPSSRSWSRCTRGCSQHTSPPSRADPALAPGWSSHLLSWRFYQVLNTITLIESLMNFTIYLLLRPWPDLARHSPRLACYWTPLLSVHSEIYHTWEWKF